MTEPDDKVCARPGCGHPADRHSIDEKQNLGPLDPGVKFRCNWGMSPGMHGEQPDGCPSFVRLPE